MLVEPLLDFFPLGRSYDTLPLHDSRKLAVFSHYVGTLVQNLYNATRLCPLESERRERGMLLLHLISRIAEALEF